MTQGKLSDDIRRFILSIESVPHLEAILLLHETPNQEWDSAIIARRLYLSEERIAVVMKDLSAAGICSQVSEEGNRFIYRPQFVELNNLIDELAVFYANNLIEVTNMIHSKSSSSQRIRQFADAFKLRKDN